MKRSCMVLVPVIVFAALASFSLRSNIRVEAASEKNDLTQLLKNVQSGGLSFNKIGRLSFG